MFSPDHSDRAEQQAKDTADYRDALQSSADFADKSELDDDRGRSEYDLGVVVAGQHCCASDFRVRAYYDRPCVPWLAACPFGLTLRDRHAVCLRLVGRASALLHAAPSLESATS